MALNDSCYLLIETKHHFIQKSGGLEQNLGGGLEPLSPIAKQAAVELPCKCHEQTVTRLCGHRYRLLRHYRCRCLYIRVDSTLDNGTCKMT